MTEGAMKFLPKDEGAAMRRDLVRQNVLAQLAPFPRPLWGLLLTEGLWGVAGALKALHGTPAARNAIAAELLDLGLLSPPALRARPPDVARVAAAAERPSRLAWWASGLACGLILGVLFERWVLP